ncbi:MAG: hypothetical protein QM780_17380 [Hyphomicrobium sp.]|uniref:hypothetical protein n=1 Tax=Hyphomicrobium sp. TaxID=82 RepID=UPI0039E45CD1
MLKQLNKFRHSVFNFRSDVRDDLRELKSAILELNGRLGGLEAVAANEGLRAQIGSLQYQLQAAEKRLLLAQGAILKTVNRGSSNLQDSEFRIFSQWGEDGIINYLVENLDIANHTFIEFGVEDFSEANCRFLLEDRNWSGFVIDGSPENIGRLNSWGESWKYSLQAHCAFITRENIASLLAESGFDTDVGILSIDIDGVDYWVAAELKKTWRPRILIMEYNAVFGRDRAITVPYSDNFQRTVAHHSNLYWGASLKALVHLAASWGYALVGTNNAGNNAFFVRRDLLNNRVFERSLEETFTDSKYRESRDETGRLNFLSGSDRVREIAGLPVINVETGGLEAL